MVAQHAINKTHIIKWTKFICTPCTLVCIIDDYLIKLFHYHFTKLLAKLPFSPTFSVHLLDIMFAVQTVAVVGWLIEQLA